MMKSFLSLALFLLSLAFAAPAFATDATSNPTPIACDGAWHSLGAGPAKVENKQPSTPVQIAVGGGTAPSLTAGHYIGGVDLAIPLQTSQTIWALCPVPPSGASTAQLVVTTLSALTSGGGGGGGGSTNLAGLTDVNVTEGAGIDGRALVYVNSAGQWQAIGVLKPSNNLSDLGSAATARSNLGLGSLAMASSFVGPYTMGSVQTTGATLSANTFYPLNIATSQTFNLPATCSSGAVVPVKDKTGTLSLSVVATISGNGANIDGKSTFPMNTPYQANAFLCEADASWSIIQ